MKEPLSKSKKPWIFGFLAIAIFFLFSSTFFLQARFKSSFDVMGLDDISFYLWAFTLAVFYIVFRLFSYRYFEVEFNFIVFAVLSAFALLNILGAIVAKDIFYQGNLIYTFSISDKFRSIVLALLLFYCFYLLIQVVPKLVKSEKAYLLFYLGFSIVALIAIIYSYIAESEQYIKIFASKEVYIFPFKSFTSNRNTYAYLLFIGLVSQAMLIVYRPRIVHWVLFFFYGFNIVFPGSKTCFGLGALFFVAFVIYNLIYRIKRHPFRAILPLIIFILISTFLLSFGLVDCGGILSYVYNFFQSVLKEVSGTGLKTFGARFDQFNLAINLFSSSLNNLFLGVGYGGGYAAFFIASHGSMKYDAIDSAFANDILNGGLFNLIFAILGWAFLLGLVVYSLYKKDRYSFLYLAIYVCVILRSLTEFGDLSYFGYGHCAIYLLLLCPILTNNVRGNEEIVLKDNKESVTKGETPKKREAYIVLGVPFLVFVSLLISFKPLSRMGISFFSSYMNFLLMSLSYLVALFSLLALHYFAKEKKWLYVIIFSLIDVLYISMVISLYFVSEIALISVSSTICALVVILFVSIKELRGLLIQEYIPLLFYLVCSALFVTFAEFFYALAPIELQLFTYLYISLSPLIYFSFFGLFLSMGDFPFIFPYINKMENYMQPLILRYAILNEIKRKF